MDFPYLGPHVKYIHLVIIAQIKTHEEEGDQCKQ